MVMVFGKATTTDYEKLVILDVDHCALGTSYTTWDLGCDKISKATYERDIQSWPTGLQCVPHCPLMALDYINNSKVLLKT
jgi:hypothetical protein